MAALAVLTQQMAVVVSEPEKVFGVALADLIRDSQALVIRHAYQATYGFTSDDQVPGGTTLEKMLQEAYTMITGKKGLPPDVIKTALDQARETVLSPSVNGG
jgi:hypothetical protein